MIKFLREKKYSKAQTFVILKNDSENSKSGLKKTKSCYGIVLHLIIALRSLSCFGSFDRFF